MTTPTDTHTTVRHPQVEDGAVMWQLAQDSGGLDTNSPYAYLLMCTHFAGTCLIAEMGGEPVGFVTGYRPPTHPDTVFVWQIAVAPPARRTGLARRMVTDLLHSPACRGVRYLEATVTEANLPSAGLFESMANKLGTQYSRSTMFETNHFPVSHQAHGSEILLRIGPFDL